MPMMGSTLELDIVTPAVTGVGATYRYSGRMMGLTIDFSETVTQYKLGRRKVWHTIGTPRLLIIAGYEMAVLVEPILVESARLTIGIDPDLDALRVAKLDRPSDLQHTALFACTESEYLPFSEETFGIALLAWSF